MRHRSYKTITLMLIGLLIWTSCLSGGAFAQPLTEEELEAIEGSQVLIDDLRKEGAALNAEASAYGAMEVVAAEGQPFAEALRFRTVTQPASAYLLQYILPIEGPIAKDDVLLATFYARAVSSTVETGEGQLALVLEKKGTWEKSLTETVAIPTQWKKFIVPIKAAVDMPEGQSQLTLRLGFKPQTVEIGGLELTNFMKAVTFDQLPSTPVTYVGMEDDAPWRAEANQRIEQVRKGDFEIAVVDKQGQPVAGADVQLRMTNHEFKFGTAVNSALALGTDANAELYRAKLKENFNSAVMENEMKWPWWEADRARAVKLYNWLGENGFSVRGHNLLWDSESRMPADIGGLLQDRAKLDARIAEHIHETAGYFRGRLLDWDVLNEPVLNRLIRGRYGDAIAADWFKRAKEADPDAKLFVNETQILGVDAPVIASLSSILQTLKDNGAPLDGVGIQAHFGSTPVSPMAFYDQVTHFAQYAPEIAITEFDMNSPREDIQGKFTHDLLLAMFSHPNVTSFTLWGFWDGAHWQNNAPLFRGDWSLKPSGEAWRSLIYDTWWTETAGQTDASGVYAARGFYGEYDITVTHNGVSQTVPASFLKEGSRRVSVTLGEQPQPAKPFEPLPLPTSGSDITAPVWPYGSAFSASDPSPTSVTLSWPAARDNIAVTSYRIYKDGAFLLETAANVTRYDVTGLAPDHSYTFAVEAVDGAGNRSVPGGKLAVKTVADADQTLPGWKNGSLIKLSGLGETSVRLKWQAADDRKGKVAGYKIYVNGQLDGETAEREYALDGLSPNVSYTVRVAAKDKQGNLSEGGPVVVFRTIEATDTTAPAWKQPTLTSSELTADGVTLHWSGAQDAVGVAAYRLSDGDREIVTLPPSASSYRVDGLSGGRAYAFRVEAADDAGNWSNTGPTLAITTPSATRDVAPPSWPLDRKLQYGTLTDRSVTLRWSAADDNGGVTGYRIYRNGDLIATVDGAAREYAVQQLEAGRAYSFRVEAVDAAGNWSSGGPSVAVTTPAGVVRSETKVLPSGDAFIQAPAVFGGDGTNQNALGYLRYKNAAGASGSEQNRNTGNNRRVYLQFPLNDVQGSVYSATLSVYVYAVQTPNVDIGLDVYATGDDWTETTINWKNKPADGSRIGGAVVRNAGYWKSIPVTDYVVAERNGDQVVSFKLTDDKWLDQNVDMYSREASGANAVFKPYLLIGTEDVPADTQAPAWEGARAEANRVTPLSATFSWSAAADDAGVNGYRIYQDGVAIATIAADQSTYEANGLQPSTAYAFKVEAFDAAQETTDGPAIRIETPAADMTPPEWPSTASPRAADVGRFGATIQWPSATDNYGIETYVVYNGGTAVAELPGSANVYELRGLRPGTSYTIRIGARDAAGNETTSAPLKLTTQAPDTAPPKWNAGGKAAVSSESVSGAWLEWPQATDDTGTEAYRIYVEKRMIAEVGKAVRGIFITGLKAETSYDVHVVAVDAAGNVSKPLKAEKLRTLERDTIVPQWPTGSRIEATSGKDGVKLRWEKAEDNVEVKQYRLYRDGAIIALLDGRKTSYTDAGQTDGETVYHVEASDPAGNWTTLGPSTGM
ncbi:GH35 family endo-1,4-beta-xylanase [Paenibacillus methanolicus]|uniref:Beta-xylanase n=2 Tax=Paenibacillus methanolicus TaxID=582686 RepID=A0A5S5C3G4_9BACL|nr:GH35 family endo-1,4-beta-xylanase [Paenibacillus methanolicus]